MPIEEVEAMDEGGLDGRTVGYGCRGEDGRWLVDDEGRKRVRGGFV
jgi:hypothetical protein